MDSIFFETEAKGSEGRVLIVDDSPVTIESLRLALQERFDVETVTSGEACLERLAAGGAPPDLVLLDIEMDGIDGLETCRRLRAGHDMPVVFVSSHDELSDRIAAFDSGGDDFVVKPFDPEVLLRKARRIVQFHAERKALAAEKASLQSMAMGFLKNIGDTGVLLAFMRSSLGLSDYYTLAQRLVEATGSYGVRCHVQIRHDGESTTVTPDGLASPLEASVLEKSARMGRIFQFGRRMVVNYDLVSVLIIDVPQDDEEAGKLRDNIAILTESAEAIAETIGMRQESAKRAEALQVASHRTADAVETLRDLYRKQQSDTRIRLQEMIDDVERAYVNLGLSDSQEDRVSSILRDGADKVLQLFDVGIEFDARFAQILDALRPGAGGAGRQ